MAVPLIWLEIGKYENIYQDWYQGYRRDRIRNTSPYRPDDRLCLLVHVEMPPGETLGTSTLTGRIYTTDEHFSVNYSEPGMDPSWNWCWFWAAPAWFIRADMYGFVNRAVHVYNNEVWNGWRSRDPIRFYVTPECLEGQEEVIEYCPDGITPRKWRECINYKWVVKVQTCPPTVAKAQIVRECPKTHVTYWDGVSFKKVCVNETAEIPEGTKIECFCTLKNIAGSGNLGFWIKDNVTNAWIVKSGKLFTYAGQLYQKMLSFDLDKSYKLEYVGLHYEDDTPIIDDSYGYFNLNKKAPAKGIFVGTIKIDTEEVARDGTIKKLPTDKELVCKVKNTGGIAQKLTLSLLDITVEPGEVIWSGETDRAIGVGEEVSVTLPLFSYPGGIHHYTLKVKP